MDDPQPSPNSFQEKDMGKVQRLDGGGSPLLGGLRYSPASNESSKVFYWRSIEKTTGACGLI